MKCRHSDSQPPIVIGKAVSDFGSPTSKLYAGCCCCCCCCLFWVGGVIGAVIGRNSAMKALKIRDDQQYIRAVYWFWIVFLITVLVSFLSIVLASNGGLPFYNWMSEILEGMNNINAVVLGGFFPIPHVIFSMIASWIASVGIHNTEHQKHLRKKLWRILIGSVVGYLLGAGLFLPFIFSTF
jgi:hypothetical protein